MGLEPRSDNIKPLGLYPELKHGDAAPTKTGAALELLKETTHDKKGPKTERTILGLEQHPKAKKDDGHINLQGPILGLEHHPKARKDSQIEFERAISGFEPYSAAEHRDYETTIDDAISGLELHSEARHINNNELSEVGRSTSSLSSSSISSSGSLKKLDIGKGELLGDSFSRSEISQSPRIESLSLSDNLPQTPQWSMVSATPRAGSGHVSSELLPPTPDWSMFNNSSAMKSPKVQTMSRPAGYDPNRIPSHVFSTRPATPMEWSVASNESLFSIHMGNNSFSKDHIVLMGDTKSEEGSNFPPPSNNVSEVKTNESSSFASNLPPVLEAASETDKKVAHKEEDPELEDESREVQNKSTTETLQETHKEKVAPGAQEVALSTTSSNLSDGKGSSEGIRISVSAPRASSESATSTGSFAFPLLVEAGKSPSLKAINEEKREEVQPQPKPKDQIPTATKASGGNWFSYFACWPRCC